MRYFLKWMRPSTCDGMPSSMYTRSLRIYPMYGKHGDLLYVLWAVSTWGALCKLHNHTPSVEGGTVASSLGGDDERLEVCQQIGVLRFGGG